MATHLRSIDDLSDEIIMLIICQLADPTSLSMTSKRLHRIAGDPYVRSSYFLARYGSHQAFYWALGRGKLLNERVLDILLSSGARLSRYLFQTAIHHYFRTTAHFIKHPWARTLPLPVFTYFMRLGTLRYGDVPRAKGEDDGAVFLGWLKDRISPGFGRKVDKDVIKGLFTDYGFMVFSPKDPIALQLPLAFALEPSLLPLAVANGFHMDSKVWRYLYRDFIFRKMFERQNREGRVAEIMSHVREMTSLDGSMFLSRTVAAEVCMECRTNEAGYLALKKLDLEGELLFELKDLVHDLLKLFLKTRSITSSNTVLTLQTLYRDFPSSSHYPTAARLVMLLTVFCTSPPSGTLYVDVANLPAKLTTAVIKAKLEHLGVLPLTRFDLIEVLVSPWCERPAPVLAWAREQMEMNELHLLDLAEEVAIRCLCIGCKGKFIRRLAEMYPSVRARFASNVPLYRIEVWNLPDYWADGDGGCEHYRTRLGASFGPGSAEMYSTWAADQSADEGDYTDDGLLDNIDSDGEGLADEDVMEGEGTTKVELGLISQDTLTSRIQDTDNGFRPRRPYWHNRFINPPDTQSKLPYPLDSCPVGRWVLEAFGPRSPVTGVFMTHAIINHNASIVAIYLDDDVPRSQHVPVTLEHFKIMARLGRDPLWLLWREIEHTEFYFSQDDYLEPPSQPPVFPGPLIPLRAPSSTKVEDQTPEFETKTSVITNIPTFQPPEQSNPCKRPRRSTAAAPSYVVPGSDDEAIAGDDVSYDYMSDMKGKGKAKVESNLQNWIKHLTELLKEEELKYKEKKKTIEKKENGKPKYRLAKSEFMKSLATHLRDMRITERQNRLKDTLYRRGKMADMDSEYESMEECDDDDEYVLHQRKAKKRRSEISRMDIISPH